MKDSRKDLKDSPLIKKQKRKMDPFALVISITIIVVLFILSSKDLPEPANFPEPADLPSPESQIPNIKDLITNPERYIDKTITITGYVEYVRSESYFAVTSYYDMATKTMKTSLSEVKTITYLLYESNSSSQSITMIDENGPRWFPAPIVYIHVKEHSGHLEVIGTLMRDDKQNQYFIDVHSVKKIGP